jgi:hypothetical protein
LPGSDVRSRRMTGVTRCHTQGHTLAMDEPLSEAQLAELERLTEAAAPAPWVSFVQNGLGGDSFIRLDGLDDQFPPDMYILRETRSLPTRTSSSSPQRGTTCPACWRNFGAHAAAYGPRVGCTFSKSDRGQVAISERFASSELGSWYG